MLSVTLASSTANAVVVDAVEVGGRDAAVPRKLAVRRLNLAHAREHLGVEAVQLAEGDVEEVAAAAGRVEDAVA
jgi:hypothetical protein